MSFLSPTSERDVLFWPLRLNEIETALMEATLITLTLKLYTSLGTAANGSSPLVSGLLCVNLV